MKYIIIGAVAGGASTAARLRRMDEHATIILFEKGAYISYANCGLPYYIGNVIKDRNKLFVQTAAAFHQRFNIDVRSSNEVLSIHPDRKIVRAVRLSDGFTYEESYDKLVLSPGAEPIKPPLPGITLPGIFTLRNVVDTDQIKAYAQQNSLGRAVVVGAGFIGLEMAENLHGLGMQVSIVELGQQVLAPVDFPIAARLQQHIRSKGVALHLNAAVTGFEQDGAALSVNLSNGNKLPADMVILSIGVKPDTRLAAAAGLKIGSARGIWVNEYLQTSDPDIYAVGDAIEFPHPITGHPGNTYLAGPANKQGRICADNIVSGNVRKYKGAINTAIVKVFNMTAGTTGMAAKQLTAVGIPHIVSTTTSGSHAGYYPDAQQMVIQLTLTPDDGKILGAQIVGYEGVDKRLDVVASLIQQGGTIYDLAEFEHAYAPPYSSAKDPLNMAGFVAENLIHGRLKVIYWNEVADLGNDALLVDVRNPDEYSRGTIPGAINLPVDAVREHLHQLPRDRDINIFCQIGLRGYIAQRILLQNGYTRVKNISGGFGLYEICREEKALLG